MQWLDAIVFPPQKNPFPLFLFPENEKGNGLHEEERRNGHFFKKKKSFPREKHKRKKGTKNKSCPRPFFFFPVLFREGKIFPFCRNLFFLQGIEDSSQFLGQSLQPVRLREEPDRTVCQKVRHRFL